LLFAAACTRTTGVELPPDGGPLPDGGSAPLAVLEHHAGPRRAGLYLDSSMTRAAAAALHRDASFHATFSGNLYAQPLYWVAATAGAPDLVIAATEQNEVLAFNAAGGALVWHRSLGAPVPRARLDCGNIDPLGVTGTPVIDAASRTLLVDAMTTPDGGTTKRHLVFALSLDDGSVRAGWPVDVAAAVPGFDAAIQNQRGALALLGGTVYVPFGGHFGDCDRYHGRVVGISLADPTRVVSFATAAVGAGIWAPGGIAHDGTSLFVTTGNQLDSPTSWSGGEAVLRLSGQLAFSGADRDYFTPSNWQVLDSGDVDLGGTGPVLFDRPGGGQHLAAAFGKDGNAFVLDRDNLGGVDGRLSVQQISAGEIITAAAAYSGPSGTYLAVLAQAAACSSGSGIVGLRLADAPAGFLTVAWCGAFSGAGAASASASAVDASGVASDLIVWAAGAEGDDRLHAWNGETGAVIYAGGGSAEQLGNVRRFQPPIVTGGRVFVGGDGQIYAFTPY
jgi:outer membrane protein assembly factor BamB